MCQKHTEALFSPVDTWSLFCLCFIQRRVGTEMPQLVHGREQTALKDSCCVHGQREPTGTTFPINVPGPQAPAAICPT